MKLAGLHPDELRRLQSLRASGLLNSGKEERFDRLTRLARTLYDLPVASVSLVGENTLHVKSCAGLEVDTLPRDITFCAHTILQTDPLIVNDLQQDLRFHDNPLVTEAPFIRFYAGYPVQLPDGATVGAFCLMDHKPRAFSVHEIQILSDLAAIVEDEFKVLDAATAAADSVRVPSRVVRLGTSAGLGTRIAALAEHAQLAEPPIRLELSYAPADDRLAAVVDELFQAVSLTARILTLTTAAGRERSSPHA